MGVKKIHFSGMAGLVSLLLILGSGCASPPVAPPPSQAQPSGVFIEQVPITSHMRSQVGTPNELSPLAPAEARNIRKVGNRWCCDLNGQGMVFNSATSCWEPQQK
jgi:hypothetical protein